MNKHGSLTELGNITQEHKTHRLTINYAKKQSKPLDKVQLQSLVYSNYTEFIDSKLAVNGNPFTTTALC